MAARGCFVQDSGCACAPATMQLAVAAATSFGAARFGARRSVPSEHDARRARRVSNPDSERNCDAANPGVHDSRGGARDAVRPPRVRCDRRSRVRVRRAPTTVSSRRPRRRLARGTISTRCCGNGTTRSRRSSKRASRTSAASALSSSACSRRARRCSRRVRRATPTSSGAPRRSCVRRRRRSWRARQRIAALAASPAFGLLRQRQATLDLELKDRRDGYNDAVREYNAAIGRVPGNLVALIAAFPPLRPLDFESAAR